MGIVLYSYWQTAIAANKFMLVVMVERYYYVVLSFARVRQQQF